MTKSDCKLKRPLSWLHGPFVGQSITFLDPTYIFSVFLILGIIDDDFLRMEHALSAITVLGIVLGVTLSLIPDDFFGKKNPRKF